MIRKLRRKIVLVLLCVELTFVLSILTGLYFSARSGFVRMSTNAMHRAARHTVSAQLPIPADTPPDAIRPPEENEDVADIPLAVLYADAAGEMTMQQNRISAFTDADLITLSKNVLAFEGDEGLLDAQQLRYLRVPSPSGGTQIVLATTALEQTLLRNLAMLSLLILLVSTGVFAGISVLLSRLLVRPVADAFERERQFVADASHELKTPLTVVLSNTEMLLSSNAITDERSLRRLDNICAESRRMRALVKNLLSLARLDTGKIRSPHTPQPLSYITACALSGFEPAIFDAGRQLSESIADNLYVSGDAARLRELLDVLMDNACKYSDPDSTIVVTLSVSHREAVLCVTSAGEPIPSRERNAIFRRFYRSDLARAHQSGCGLGLAIAHSIVAEHHGRIGVRSDTPRSNTFYVHLPLCTPPEEN